MYAYHLSAHNQLSRMDRTPFEYVTGFAMQRLEESKAVDNDHGGDVQSIFDEKLRYRALALEAPKKKASAKLKGVPHTFCLYTCRRGGA